MGMPNYGAHGQSPGRSHEGARTHYRSEEWMRLRRAVTGMVVFTIAMTTLTMVGTGTARADDPLFVDWTSQLPSWSDQYDPNSANDCVAGKPSCIDKTIREMQRRFDPLGQSCDHNAVFSLAYLRTTQTYKWARD